MGARENDNDRLMDGWKNRYRKEGDEEDDDHWVHSPHDRQEARRSKGGDGFYHMEVGLQTMMVSCVQGEMG